MSRKMWMNQTTKDNAGEKQVEYLISRLREGQSGYDHLQMPDRYEDKRQFLRALMNVCLRGDFDEEFWSVQDALLSAETQERGIVEAKDLPTIAEQYPENRLRNADRMVLWRGDITTLRADAIVNAANSQMLGCFVPCHHCIDNAIHSAAGLQLRLECARLMEAQGHEEPTGRAKITKAYNLPASYVIHTVGPIVGHAVTEEHRRQLRSCYYECLKTAQMHGLSEIAFCCISTGEFHFPGDLAAQIALETADEFLDIAGIRRVIFNVFTERDLSYYEEAILRERKEEMKKYTTVLFDLDGTLTDPKEGITKSVAYALHCFGIEEDPDNLCEFIGPPLKDSFMEYYGFDEEKAMQGIIKYREYFVPTGMFENEVYDGIREMLESLRARGMKLIVATSKPEEFAVKILEHFDLAKYFDLIAGASMDETRVKKGEVIAYAVSEAGVEDLSDAVMVGDRRHDMIGAQEEGLDSIGVLYGYGDREELEKSHATYIVETVKDLQNFLEKHS